MMAALLGTPLAAGAQTPPPNAGARAGAWPMPRIEPRPARPAAARPVVARAAGRPAAAGTGCRLRLLALDGRLLDLSRSASARDAMEQARLAMETPTAGLAGPSALQLRRRSRATATTPPARTLLNQRKYAEAIVALRPRHRAEGRQRGRRALLEGLRAVQAGQDRRGARDDRAAAQGPRRRAATWPTRRCSKPTRAGWPASR